MALKFDFLNGCFFKIASQQSVKTMSFPKQMTKNEI